MHKSRTIESGQGGEGTATRNKVTASKRKRRWTKAATNEAIRRYMADRAIQYAEFKRRAEAGEPGVEKDAQAVFGRNVIHEFLGCSRQSVTQSTAWRRIKEELRLPGNPNTPSPGRRSGASISPPAAVLKQEESIQRDSVEAVIARPPNRETVQLIKASLPAEQAAGIINQLTIRALTDKSARELVERCLAQRRDRLADPVK